MRYSPQGKRPSFLSLISWSWFTPLIRLGGRRQLNAEDVPADERITASKLAPAFEAAWSEQMKGQRSLYLALQECFGGWLTGRFGRAAYLLLGQNVLQFISPLLLKSLIAFTRSPDLPLWHGFVLVVAMFFAAMGVAVLEAMCVSPADRGGMDGDGAHAPRAPGTLTVS